LERWQELVAEFQSVPAEHRLELLLEFANSLPDLPERLQSRPELMERVEECQSPVYLITEGDAQAFEIWLTAPREAPTTRGFAALLQEALNKMPATEILGFPKDFPDQLQLSRLVSPLRMAGMQGMLSRIQRKARESMSNVSD
jgi:cysteine desulfuration protein SufE